MRYKKIPKANLNVSVISLGTWVFGGGEWGPADEKECVESVNAALECGINLIDTAPVYGGGLSEQIVGKAIKGERDKVIIATKCGLIGRGKNMRIDLTPRSIREEIEGSLKRLGMDYVDIYQCHWPDENTPVEETMAEMLRLKKEGKIKHIGVSNFDLPLLEKAIAVAEIAVVQNHYSLLERSIEKDFLPFCEKNEIGVLSYGSLGGGILTGKYAKQPSIGKGDARSFFYKFYKGEEFAKSLKVINVLKEISSKNGKPLNQIALNWINQKKGVVCAIAGGRNRDQARMNALSADWLLDEEDLKKLDAAKI
ncbi:MAG: aldo/keto reductase [Candidatus Omnitrophota bacterium]